MKLINFSTRTPHLATNESLSHRRRRGYTAAVAVVLALSAATVAAPSPALAADHVVILAGQSNGVGYGGGPYRYPAPSGRVFQVGRGGPQDMRIVRALSDQLHHLARAERSRRAGHGLAMARLYARTLPRSDRVILVPVAVPGAALAHLRPGTPAWRDLLARTDRALAASGGRGRVVAMLWQHGETDALLPPAVSRSHRAELVSMVRQLRLRYGRFAFLAGEMPRAWRAPGRTHIVRAIRGAVADLRPAAFVPSAGLASNRGDPAHFSAAAQMTLGARYHRALAGLTR